MNTIQWKISELPDGGYLGKMHWGNKETELNILEAGNTETVLLNKMLPGIKKAVEWRVDEFIKWRIKSRKKANREVTPEMQAAIYKLGDVVRKIGYTYSLRAVIRMIVEQKESIQALEPAEHNYLWRDMECLLKWAECLDTYGSKELEIRDVTKVVVNPQVQEQTN
jgi:hypothetical protein